MAQSMAQPMNLAVPKQLNYADVLPVAIESRSNKRTFEPTNGTKFSPSGTNVIRLNLNSDNLADFTHSYYKPKMGRFGGGWEFGWERLEIVCVKLCAWRRTFACPPHHGHPAQRQMAAVLVQLHHPYSKGEVEMRTLRLWSKSDLDGFE